MMPSLASSSGRRFWAFLVILGSCFIFTIFAAVGVWLVSKNEKYTFYLALAAHAQLFVGLGFFSVVGGRKMTVEGGTNGLKYSDSMSADDVKEAVQAPADAAQAKADEIKAEVTSGGSA